MNSDSKNVENVERYEVRQFKMNIHDEAELFCRIRTRGIVPDPKKIQNAKLREIAERMLELQGEFCGLDTQVHMMCISPEERKLTDVLNIRRKDEQEQNSVREQQG